MKNRSITQLAALALGVGLLLGAVYLGLEAGPAAADTPPVASRTPESIDFGSQQADTTSSPRTITVTAVSDGVESFCDPMFKPPCEISDEPTSIFNLTIGGTDAAAFSVSSQSCTGKYLWQGQTCSIEVTFSPAAAGSYSATLNINSNSSWSTGNQVQLSGSAPPATDPPVNDIPQYTIEDLGTLPGLTRSQAIDVNDSGQVVGYSDTPGGASHAFLYSSGQMQDLGTLGGANSVASGINDSGQVVGYSEVSSGDRHAFLYTGGQMKDLGTLPGYVDSSASGINDSGQVVGYSEVSSGDRHAFLYTGGQMQDLGTLGGANSVASDINDSGQVVGQSSTSSAGIHAFLYTSGQMKDLGTLPGGNYSSATDVNDSGQVVGGAAISNDATVPMHAFLYTGDQMKDLGTLPGDHLGSYALGINDSGQAVGRAQKHPFSRAFDAFPGFLYSGSQMKDLNSLIPADSGWFLGRANAINTSGQIVGEGLAPGGAGGLRRESLPSNPRHHGTQDHEHRPFSRRYRSCPHSQPQGNLL